MRIEIMKKTQVIPLFLTLVLCANIAACSRGSDSTGTAPIPNDRASALTTRTNAPSNATNPNAIVPAKFEFEADLQQEISSGKNKENDRFQLRIQNGTVGKYPFLKDAVILGHLENVVKAARGKKASLNLVFDEIRLKNGDVLSLDAELINTRIETQTKGKFLQNAGIILGGIAAGKLLEDKQKFKHGALAGGAAAAAVVLASPGNEVKLKKGTDIKLRLKTPLNAS
jgi:hypothetical protein